jgi:cAMP-dependent protein kinase regulator
MSNFDKRVAQWLNTAAIPDKAKITLLNRMSVGITNYRNLALEKAQIPGVRQGDHLLNVDYTFQDQISKAILRLKEGDSGTPEDPLFPAAKGPTPKYAQQRLSTPRRHRDPAPQAFSFGTADLNVNRDDQEEMDEEEDANRIKRSPQCARKAVSAEPVDAQEARAATFPAIPKPKEIRDALLKCLERHNLFAHLDDADLEKVADIMNVEEFRRGEAMIRRGQNVDTIYFVMRGAVINRCTGGEHRPGESFEDVLLMYDAVTGDEFDSAADDTLCCTLSRHVYQLVCSKASQEKRERYENFLSGLWFLKNLTPYEKLQLADALKAARYEKGEKLIHFGEEGTWFSIIIEGTVDVIGRDKHGKEVYVCSFKAGDCVGELEFIHKHKCVADVVASSPVVKTAKMTANHFEKVIGPARDLLERQAASGEIYSYYRQAQKSS